MMDCVDVDVTTYMMVVKCIYSVLIALTSGPLLMHEKMTWKMNHDGMRVENL